LHAAALLLPAVTTPLKVLPPGKNNDRYGQDAEECHEKSEK